MITPDFELLSFDDRSDLEHLTLSKKQYQPNEQGKISSSLVCVHMTRTVSEARLDTPTPKSA